MSLLKHLPVRLTTYTDYSLRVLMYLAVRHDGGEVATIDEISCSYQISKNHLTKVVHQLSVNGFIQTVRGRNGGARLAREPRQISVGQVVRMCEPDLAVVECHEPGKENICAISQACNLKSGFRRAMEAFMMELDRITLADAISAPSVAASLLGLDLQPQRIVPIQTLAARAARKALPAPLSATAAAAKTVVRRPARKRVPRPAA